MSDIKEIKDLKFDEHNFNKHNERGLELLEKSITENKFGRSILLDKDDNIIAGNGVTESALKLGHTKVRVIETDGDELIAVKRKDLSIDSKEGRSLALADNAVASVDLEWDALELANAQNEWGIEPEDWGVDIGGGNAPAVSDENITFEYKIEIECEDEDQQEQLYNELTERGLICRVLTL